MAGSLVGVARVAATTSIAVLVFAGPLAGHLPAAIGLTLVSEVVALTVVASLGSVPGAVAGVHPTPAPSAAVIAAAVAGTVAAGGEERFLTVVLTIALATMLTPGAVFLLVGGLRLGNLVRFTPYPVVAGFIAGTGWLLMRGSLDVMTGASAAASHWLAGVAFGLVLVAVSRRLRTPLVPRRAYWSGCSPSTPSPWPPARPSRTSSEEAGCSARFRTDPSGARGRWTRSASRTGTPFWHRCRPRRR